MPGSNWEASLGARNAPNAGLRRDDTMVRPAAPSATQGRHPRVSMVGRIIDTRLGGRRDPPRPFRSAASFFNGL